MNNNSAVRIAIPTAIAHTFIRYASCRRADKGWYMYLRQDFYCIVPDALAAGFGITQ